MKQLEQMNTRSLSPLHCVSFNETQCRGIRFHFDLMQIYNANRPTKPKTYFTYTHQTTTDFYIHLNVSWIQTQEFKKSLNRAAKHCFSPKQENLYSVHYQHMQMGHARGGKSKQKIQHKNSSC